jgi:tRNA-dihydrouridine synthase
MNFWQKMKNSGKPILCLAPMADVTDVAFRFIIAEVSRGTLDTYVTYTEFVSADGLVRAPEKGRKKLLKDLEYSEIERPIVAQFFTNKPEMMEKASALAVDLGFDGIDINMGCPDKSIEKQGAGAALIKNPKLARELIIAAKRGWDEGMRQKENACKTKAISGAGRPVSVKTRLGYNKDELETWLPELLAENPAAIIIHARTRKEMSKVPAQWARIARAVEIRNDIQNSEKSENIVSALGHKDKALETIFSDFSFRTLIIGNGDVENVEDAIKKCEESGADGAMLGRAVFGNPWLFANYQPTLEEKLKVLLEHTKLFEEKFSGVKSFAIMKKHFKEYLKDSNLRDLRFKLMKAENSKEVEEIISNFGFPTE